MQGLLHSKRDRMGFGRFTSRENIKILNGLADYHFVTVRDFPRDRPRTVAQRYY